MRGVSFNRRWLFLCFLLVNFSLFIVKTDASDVDSEEEFVGLDSRVPHSSSSSKVDTFDEILMDESVYISLNCEKCLGSSEEALKSFVMKSLDFTAEETFSDLERPACRAFFDRNGSFLTRTQIRQLMETERGRRILEDGEVLEFFADFSDFTLQDFKLFPKLKIAKIRDLSSISSEILLTLVHEGGFQNAGRLERIPEIFGERVLEHEAWRKDPEIWQLFTLEGVAQIHSIANVEKFSNFLANKEKFEVLIYQIIERAEDGGATKADDTDTIADPSPNRLINRVRSSTITSETFYRSALPVTSKTSIPLCRSFARHSNLLARWSMQMEELMLYMMELPDLGRRNANDLVVIQNAVQELLKTRSWLKSELSDRCAGAASLSESESLKIGNLKTLLESAMSWRLKEALQTPLDTATPMSNYLKTRLNSFPLVTEFYRRAAALPNDHLLTHFFLVNGIDDLGAVFEQTDNTSGISNNEKVVLSIAIRRVLFLLLSPTSESSDVIHDALNYVLSAHSPLLVTSDSTEIVRWFRQAQDLQAIPVLDQLIRNFGHEFDVSREIKAVFSDPVMRGKLFTEAQSPYVRMLAALASNLSVHLTSPSAPRTLVSPFLDSMNALLKTPIQSLPIVPNRRPWTEQEISGRALEIEQVREHNAAIAHFLQVSLSFLKTCIPPVDNAYVRITPNFSGFMQPNFKINFSDLVGIDAGGLRRTWLSALFRVFGDSQRQLFPQHLSGEGGRTPAALLDPEIMAILGTLHGKALQIGVKPDWFFSPLYTYQLLFAPEAPNPETLLQLTEDMYPGILGSLDLIMQLETDAVDYFNASGFPTLAGLEGSVEARVNEALEAVVDEPVLDEMDLGADSTPYVPALFEDSDNDSVMSDIAHELLAERTGTVEMFADTFESSHSPVVVEHVRTANAGSAAAPPNTPLNSHPRNHHTQTLKPLRHSFSRMLVFDVRFLAQDSIYSGPRHTVTSLPEIAAYRSAILALFSQNLLAGRTAYWRNFGMFFEDRFRSQMEPGFLHGLFAPPRISIEEILTRINFHRECDSIFLIDDDDGTVSEETVDTVDDTAAETKEPESKKRSHNDSNINRPNTRPRTHNTIPHSNLNISARTALTRILSNSLASPSQLSSLLSFSTGCPQIPPAGLDALRISVRCVAVTPDSGKMSKSHTCSNTIDFYASVGVKETKAAFIESVLSSSGFGFD